jgi:hypothetical protein
MAFRQPGLVVNTREWSALNRYFISQVQVAKKMLADLINATNLHMSAFKF